MKIWFQNRRTKWKKTENISNEEAARIMKSKLGGERRVRIQVNGSVVMVVVVSCYLHTSQDTTDGQNIKEEYTADHIKDTEKILVMD